MCPAQWDGEPVLVQHGVALVRPLGALALACSPGALAEFALGVVSHGSAHHEQLPGDLHALAGGVEAHPRAVLASGWDDDGAACDGAAGACHEG